MTGQGLMAHPSPLQQDALAYYRQVERSGQIGQDLARYRQVVANRDRQGRPTGIGFAVNSLHLADLHGRRISGLDFGCGAGVLVAEVARTQEWDVYGVDADANLLESARKWFPKVADRLLTCDALASPLPFPAGRFDFVFCNSVIQHFDASELVMALSEIARVTVRRGLLALTFKELLPAGEHDFADVDSTLTRPPGRLLRLYAAPAIERFAAAAGFRPHEASIAPYRYLTKDGFNHVTMLLQKAP